MGDDKEALLKRYVLASFIAALILYGTFICVMDYFFDHETQHIEGFYRW